MNRICIDQCQISQVHTKEQTPSIPDSSQAAGFELVLGCVSETSQEC